MEDKTIYTRDEAAAIVELFEAILEEYDIIVPSPEDDDDRDEDSANLYGTTYYGLLDQTEQIIMSVIERIKKGEKVVTDRFSGRS